MHERATICMPDVRALPTDAPTFVSLYSGCGGLDLGFVAAGFRPVWANDFDRHACETYRRVLGSHIVHGSVTDIQVPVFEDLDLVVGGPPCQGFSVAGQMRGDDPRSSHVFHYMDVVERLQPKIFVLENVKALGVNARWEAIRHALIQRALAAGYSPRLMVLNAAEYGVAQRRERMFLVGSRVGPVGVPAPSTVPGDVNVGDVLRQLPRFGRKGNEAGSIARISPAKNPVLRTSPYRGSLLFNGMGRPLDLGDTAPTIPASMGGNATPIVDQAQLDGTGGGWVGRYHRQLMKGRVGGAVVPATVRRITVAEAAVIQSFPLGMNFSGPLGAQYRQVGNAVPPLLGKAVAQEVARALDGAANRPLVATANVAVSAS